MYDDGSSEDFIIGELEVRNVQTHRLQSDEKAEIRMSIGMRNPQEDSYDVTSIRVKYHQDHEKVKFDCIDGFANGSTSTTFFEGGLTANTDNYGRHNITVKEWTDYILPTNSLTFRVPEKNDCIFMEGSATPRQDFGSYAVQGIEDKNIQQTFKGKYKKPFKASSLEDFNMIPDQVYNVTSYFSCYENTEPKKWNSIDPTGFYNAKTDWNKEGWGCRPLRQTTTGDLLFTKWDKDTKLYSTGSKPDQ